METGTLPLAAKQKVRSVLAEKGVILLDYALSGTGVHAKAKDLTVYASGDTDAIKQLAPIVDGFARVCYDLGDFGNGTKMKFVPTFWWRSTSWPRRKRFCSGFVPGSIPRQW
jgi:3-hydroxyisobutyrate dehydrogenase-like beta-hydroxyacid dehydrogenase